MIIFLGRDYDLYDDIIHKSKKDKKDIVVSCQYPYKIPSSLIKSHICVNIHYGILPHYGGMYPVYWQIKNGDTAGVTIHYVDNEFDTGDIIKTWEMPHHGLTADEVYGHLRTRGRLMFEEMYRSILNGTAPKKPQNKELRRYYDKNSVNWKETCVAKINDDDADSNIRSFHFEGKQLPTIEINKVIYELKKKGYK
jgi:methionyl-tRNA formyltransferase